MSVRRAAVALLVPLVVAGLATTPAVADRGHDHGPEALHSLRGPVTDENFYFVMADRFANGDTANDQGGLGADPLVSGFDPTKKGFYNGGDLKGLRGKLDYIQDLGTTSIWLTPSFKNKAVQLEDGPSAGYHGYWITDFTQIDPHLGTNADLAALIKDAHKRGMKVYFDIITNHTADVIGYQEGARKAYTSKDVAPYRTASGQMFDDRDYAGTNGFPALDAASSFPYHPVLDPAEQNLKVPAWLNDPTLYHNRGDTTFTGEDSQYGDFFGLDDLFTENPRVVKGMTDVYEKWIADFGVDGFRIDTMKHVNDEFWQKFGPDVLKFAHQHGKREFFMFGEVFDTTKSYTSHFTTTDTMQSVLDFPFQDAARKFASGGGRDRRAVDVLRRRRLVHRRRLQRLRATDVPRQPRHGAVRQLRGGGQPGRGRRGVGVARPARPRADVLLARQPGDLLRRRAGLHRPGRRPGRAADAVRVAGAGVPRRRPARHVGHARDRQLRHDAPAVLGDRQAGVGDAGEPRAARRHPAETGCPLRTPGSTRSPGSTGRGSASTWWR